MPKAYWIVCYRAVTNPAALAEYAKLSAPAVHAAGGSFLVRGGRTKVHEGGLEERTVVIEFDSMDAAIAAYESEAYAKALAVLGDAAERDLRIVEGVG